MSNYYTKNTNSLLINMIPMIILQAGVFIAIKVFQYVFWGTMALAAIASIGEIVVTSIDEWLESNGLHILVLGRPFSGKSMFFRSLQGKYCQESDVQTNGEESVSSFKAKVNGKTIKFAKTSDIAGARILHETIDNNPSKVADLLPAAEKIFFICDIQEYLKNKVDANTQKTPQEDILERLGQISRLKNINSSLDIIFSHVDSVSDHERQVAEENFKSQLTNERYGSIHYYEVDFMNEEKVKNLINNLFKS